MSLTHTLENFDEAFFAVIIEIEIFYVAKETSEYITRGCTLIVDKFYVRVRNDTIKNR